jgi:hypothetical protein
MQCAAVVGKGCLVVTVMMTGGPVLLLQVRAVVDVRLHRSWRGVGLGEGRRNATRKLGNHHGGNQYAR